jgi:hypothetical protein
LEALPTAGVPLRKRWKPGSNRQSASFDDLHEGASIQVRFIGGVDDSYSVQATGGTIVLLRAKSE